MSYPARAEGLVNMICLVGVSAVWLMVFPSFSEMRAMSEVVSICNRTVWLFSFSDTYFLFDLVFRRKVSLRRFVCVFLSCLCLLCGCLCIILCTGRVQNLSLSPFFSHSRQRCILNGHLPVKRQPLQFQEVDEEFFMRWPCCCWCLLFLNDVDCRCCCRS